LWTTSPTDAKCFNNGSASQEYGFAFTSPANAAINVKGVSFVCNQSSAVGPMKYRLYTGASTSACVLAADTNTCTVSQVSGNQQILYFANPVTIPPSTVCRLVIADASSTGSSTKYFTPGELAIDSACPAALLPFDGSMVKTTTPSGATAVGNSPVTAFTDSAIGTLMMAALLLDTNGEFAAAATVPVGKNLIYNAPTVY